MLELLASTFTQGRLIVIGLALLAAAAVSGYAYHKITVLTLNNTIANLQTDIERLNADIRMLKANQAIFEAAAKQNQDLITSLQTRLESQATQARDLTIRTQNLQRERDRYMSIFREHDLTKLARAKPGLIENRVNSGTEKLFQDLSGASAK